MREATFVYKRLPGCEILLDVYRPDDAATRPGIVWIHGGALIGGSRAGIRPAQRDRYVAGGNCVISIDYRLAPETRLPAIAEDLRDAFAWVRSEGPRLFRVDPARLAVVGHSAGGYLALLSGCLAEPRPTAIVSFYGYGDIAGDWYARPDPFYCRQPHVGEEAARSAVGHRPISGADGPTSRRRSRFYLYCRQRGTWPQEVAGHDPFAEPEAFDRYCPVRHVTPAYPPTLLLHGDRDTDVPYEQATLMAAALARASVEHELITIAGGGHGFDREPDRPDVAAAFDRAVAFLQRHNGERSSA
jgi:acetyl esterase/lipase